jgi:N-acetylmuramoyl-L-alanine amidase
LIFQEKQVLAYNITEDNEYIYIKAVHPKQKYSKIVIIDPGHGGGAPGASANGLVEKNLTLDTSLRLMKLFENDGRIKAYATRLTDVNVDLYRRPTWANSLGDLFVSIHMNAMGGGNTSANGTEVYYYPHSNDSSLGFSGWQLASILQRNLLADLGSVDRKVQTAPFVVIRNTTIPSALVEVGFITNRTEAGKLATPDYRQRAAESIFRSVIEAFNMYTTRR